MKTIFLSELTDPIEIVAALEHTYQAMLKSAERENDLRNYLIASLMIKTLEQAKDMYRRATELKNGHKEYYCYNIAPSFSYVEESDSIDVIIKHRFAYVYNSAQG